MKYGIRLAQVLAALFFECALGIAGICNDEKFVTLFTAEACDYRKSEPDRESRPNSHEFHLNPN
jgi:hypothetical protein